MDPIEGIDPNRMAMQASTALYNQVASRDAMFGAMMPSAPPPAFDLSDSLALGPPPPMASPGDMSYFFDKMRRMKQEALLEAYRRGYRPRPTDPTKPTDPNKPDGQKAGGPLDVRAHAYNDGGKMVPVKDIRIWEVNNYKNRTWNSFRGDWPEQDLRLGKTTVGKYYRVQVTWENGLSETRDVRMDSPNGQTLDFYKY